MAELHSNVLCMPSQALIWHILRKFEGDQLQIFDYINLCDVTHASANYACKFANN